MGIEKVSLSMKCLLPLLAVAFPAQLLTAGESSVKYVVLMVTDQDGKVFHKPLADKNQDNFKKSLDDAYTKAKKAFADEKKSFAKENPGKKFDKSEPQKPKTKVVKRDIKTFLEAKNLAFEIDKAREKNDKSKTNGNGNGKNGNGKNGKNGNGSTESKPTDKDK